MASSDTEENKPKSDGIPDDFPQFNDRYTDKDEDYARTLKSDLPPPPCVDNWYVRPKRTYDWTRDNGRGRGRGGHAHYAGRRDHSDNRYNPYGRGGGRDGYQDRRDRHDHHRDNRRHYDDRRSSGGGGGGGGGWNR